MLISREGNNIEGKSKYYVNCIQNQNMQLLVHLYIRPRCRERIPMVPLHNVVPDFHNHGREDKNWSRKTGASLEKE